jgi:hypothetical protein
MNPKMDEKAWNGPKPCHTEHFRPKIPLQMRSKDLLLRCRTLYEVLDGYLDGEMGLREKLLLKGHLMMCPP